MEIALLFRFVMGQQNVILEIRLPSRHLLFCSELSFDGNQEKA